MDDGSNPDMHDGSSTVDRIGPESVPPTGGGGRRTVVAAASAVALVAAAGAGVWAWQSWLAQGPQPAEALPADTLAYVAVDLDPPGGQKVGALGVVKKFPSLAQDLGLEGDDDLRRAAFEEFASEGSCELDYAADVEPWIGQRAAFAIVPQDRPRPVVVLQLGDRDKAEEGLAAVRDCARENGEETGYALDGDWVVLAEDEEVARRVVTSAQDSSLAGDDGYRTWTSAAGDPGFLTLYAAPEAGAAVLDAVDEEPFAAVMALPLIDGLDPVGLALGPLLSMATVAPLMSDIAEAEAEVDTWPEELAFTEEEQEVIDQLEHLDQLTRAEQEELFERSAGIMEKHYGALPVEDPPGHGREPEFDDPGFADEEFPPGFSGPRLPEDLRRSLEEFGGLGGVVRFADGGVELEVVSDRLEGTMARLATGEAADDVLAGMPSDVAFAFGAGFAPGWGGQLMEHLAGSMLGEPSAEEQAEAFEAATGLDLPGDLDVLAGESAALVAGAGIDPATMLDDPSRLRVAARVQGDPDRIEAALATLRASLPADQRALVVSRRVTDGVVVGPNAAYVDEVARGGRLGDSSRFRDVVRDAGGATSILYVDFDAGDWLVRSTDESERGDAEPLEALGFSRVAEGDRERLVVRLAVED